VARELRGEDGAASADLGPRPTIPPRLSPRQANQFVRRAAELASSPPEEEALLEEMVAQYHERVARGAEPEDAARRALEPPPDFSNVRSGGPGAAVAGDPQGAPPPPNREQLVESTRGIVEQAAQRGITVDERDIEAMVRDLASGATPEQVLQQLLRGAGT
jgi:hypothetical protein